MELKYFDPRQMAALAELSRTFLWLRQMQYRALALAPKCPWQMSPADALDGRWTVPYAGPYGEA